MTTTYDLLTRPHPEVLFPCDVQPSSAPDLIVTCRRCGAQLKADLVSPCVGGRTDSRVILMLRCSECGSAGQLRFAKEAPWQRVPPAAKTPTPTVEIRAGGPGYVGLACACGGHGMYVTGHDVDGGVLELRGNVEGCGHSVELRLPCTSTFTAKPHFHGAA